MRCIHFLLFCALLVLAAAWTKEDHEIFRLKDELEAAEGPGVSFYEFLGVAPLATVDDINKAFRKKSRTLHPDKAKQSFVASQSVPKPKKKGEKRKPGVHVSKGPSQRDINRFMKEASQRYSRLGVITGVLKDRSSRERYDHFVRHGFPAWRGTGYYYARYRPGLGTVVIGLFLVGGGGAHYLALKISYNRQREFMERLIKHSRKMAWGDESGIQGIPGITSPAEPPPPPAEEPDPMANLNRRQKRELEKQQKKDKSKGKSSKPNAKPQTVATPTGARRRVTAENGKVFVVDSIGNVFLEEEDEDGNVQEFLLDLDDIKKPNIRDTAVVRFPLWLWEKAFDSFRKNTMPVPSDEVHVTESEKKQSEPVELEATVPTVQAQDLSASQISDAGFEIVDSTGIEAEENAKRAKMRKKGKK